MLHPWSSQQFIEGARQAGRSPEVIDAAVRIARRIKQSNPDLPVIFSLQHLGQLVDVSATTLRKFVDRSDDAYRVFRVKKRARPGRGSSAPRRYRTICIPTPVLMRTQRWIAQNILNVLPTHEASYAFTLRRDLVGAANRHAGCKWLIKMDVRHFFESIEEHRIYRIFVGLGYTSLLSFEMARLCTRVHSIPASSNGADALGAPYRHLPEGHLPQGAPTSPMLANLAVHELDKELTKLAQIREWTYTRYADDLAFSTINATTRGQAMELAKLAERELINFGLKANRQKTSITPPGARKILLGVLVDRETPRLTKAFRNNIETHLFALTNPKIGVAAHRANRAFASTIGMRRHLSGLIAFAHHVDPAYAAKLYADFNVVNWNS